jgi:hypothetical protein
MGEVFQALAEDTGQRLALKMLHAHGAKALERLKREFRAISGLVHPNLLRLYELHLDHELPFLTMELVEGMPLLDHVRPDGQPNVDRLRQWLLEMADALAAIHAAGQLHHDIKPSNLRVRHDGQLVVLDFGLARAIGSAGDGPSSGTPVYMAPERLGGGAADPASDWYGVGVVLYEALSGHLPYELSSGVIDRRELRPMPLPQSLPSDLRVLCLRLLRREPGSRPGAFEVRAALGANLKARPPHVAPERSVFVGRSSELEQLREAFETACKGSVALVYVEGEPGIGKSALVARFVAELRKERAVSVLRSRCHPREFIAYNAADGLVDCLAAELKSASASEQQAICGDLSTDVVRLFPVLRALPFSTQEEATQPSEPQELRTRAFAALRLLLQRCAQRRPLVLHVDDLQWADADSESLLLDVLQPGPHPILFIGSFRAADAPHSRCIQALRAAFPIGGDGAAVPTREIALGPLSQNESRALARELGGATLSSARLEAVSRDAAGSPLFLRALLKHDATADVTSDGLRELLRNVLRDLSPSTRELLELVAIADRPLASNLLLAVVNAGEFGDRCADDLLELEQLALLRVIREGAETLFECYHDRIRETVAAEDRGRLEQHGRLASVAASRPQPDLAFVAHQYSEAGAFALAAHFAEQAGDHAQTMFALEQAGQLYALALRCTDPSRPLALLEKCAHALAAGGHCGDAAPLYLEAGERWEGSEAIRLQLCAAEMYLRSGQLKRCAAVARPALRAVGIRYPESNAGALLSAMTSVLRLRWRRFDKLPSSKPGSELAELRTEACFRLGCVLGIVVPVFGAALILKSVRLAVECGTAAQFGRALASYAWMLTSLGVDAQQRKALLLRRASEVAEHCDDAEVHAWVMVVKGINENVQGNFSASLHWISQAQTQLISKNVDSMWLRSECEAGRTTNLLLLGRMTELNTICRERIERARKQGNRFHFADARGQLVLALCARGQARQALEIADAILEAWATEPFCQAPAIAAWAKLHCLLYTGETQAACDVVSDYGPIFQQRGYMRTTLWGTGMSLAFGSVALACAFRDRNLRALRESRRAARKLRRYRTAWAVPGSDLLSAGIARLEGKLTRAATLYAQAAAGFDACGMQGYAAAARARQAELLPAEQAAAVRAAADAWFTAEAIAEPDSWTRMYAPGPG